ncbi:MAG: hypothetical protein WCJ97_04420 [Phycisphaerae bacterium]
MTVRKPRTVYTPAPSAVPAQPQAKAGPQGVSVLKFQQHLEIKRQQQQRRAGSIRALDAVLPAWFRKNVVKPGKDLELIQDVWLTVMPEKFRLCRLVALQKRQLSVAVDSASAKAALDQALRKDMLELLRTMCPGRVYTVKVSVLPAAPQPRDESEGRARLRQQKVQEARRAAGAEDRD